MRSAGERSRSAAADRLRAAHSHTGSASSRDVSRPWPRLGLRLIEGGERVGRLRQERRRGRVGGARGPPARRARPRERRRRPTHGATATSRRRRARRAISRRRGRDSTRRARASSLRPRGHRPAQTPPEKTARASTSTARRPRRRARRRRRGDSPVRGRPRSASRASENATSVAVGIGHPRAAAPPIEREVDERRGDDPAHRGDDRKKRRAPARQSTDRHLPPNLEAHDQEEEREEPLREPLARRQRKQAPDGPDAEVRVHGALVERRQRRIRAERSRGARSRAG